jgi:hypothetical protein
MNNHVRFLLEAEAAKLSGWSQSLCDEDALSAFKILSAENPPYVHI